MINFFFIGFHCLLLSIAFVSIAYSLDCEIPKGCRLGLIESGLSNYDNDIAYEKNPTVWCDFNDDF